MFAFHTYARLTRVAAGLALGAALLVVLPRVAIAGGPPYGIPSGVMPWEYQKYYQGYKHPPRGYGPRPSQPAAPVAQSPTMYTIRITQIPYKHTHDDPNVAIVMGHLPEDAQVWFDGAPTQRRGTIRYFVSPPLTPGTNYTYTVRVQWYEDGRWVSQTHSFPVHAGDVHCLDVISSRSPDLEKEIAANLAKLDPDERQAAVAQRFCAVQDGIRLGTMGTPVKVMVLGQPVYLCCKGCVDKAQASPAQTLEKVRKIKVKSTNPPSP